MKHFESLEKRAHLAADFSAAINFQPADAGRAPGMLPDYGSAFDYRRGGYQYGWTPDITGNAVKRNIAPVQRNDTYIVAMQGDKWEIAVPDGDYRVYVVAGDPKSVNERMGVLVEGEITVSGVTKSARRYLEGSKTVSIDDGRISIEVASWVSYNKLAYVGIESVSVDPEPEPETPVTVPSNLNWVKKASMPINRVEPQSAVVNDKLYVFGGYDDANFQPDLRSDVYDVKTNTWTRIADMPIATTHAATAVVGTKVWMIGGYTARPNTIDRQDIANTSTLIYDTQTNTWSTGPSIPAQRASSGLVLVDNKLYLISGEDRSRANKSEVWALDLANQGAGWQSRAPIPDARSHFGYVAVDGIIYIIGGQKNVDANATFLKSNYAYNPATNSWSRIADLPGVSSHLSPNTIVIGKKIYTFGGERAFNDDIKDVLEYDPATNTVKKLTPLPVARASGVAGFIGGAIVFSGGKDNGLFKDTYVAQIVS